MRKLPMQIAPNDNVVDLGHPAENTMMRGPVRANDGKTNNEADELWNHQPKSLE